MMLYNFHPSRPTHLPLYLNFKMLAHGEYVYTALLAKLYLVLIFWIGQNGHSGFSIGCHGKAQMNFLTNPTAMSGQASSGKTQLPLAVH